MYVHFLNFFFSEHLLQVPIQDSVGAQRRPEDGLHAKHYHQLVQDWSHQSSWPV